MQQRACNKRRTTNKRKIAKMIIVNTVFLRFC